MGFIREKTEETIEKKIEVEGRVIGETNRKNLTMNCIQGWVICRDYICPISERDSNFFT
jgi:hypothetical protein